MYTTIKLICWAMFFLFGVAYFFVPYNYQTVILVILFILGIIRLINYYTHNRKNKK